MSDAGRFVWYELLSTDPEAAARFYTSLLGWGTQPFSPQPDLPPYTIFTRGGSPIGGTMQLPADAVAAGGHAHWLGYVEVDDVDATHAAATRAGATSCVAPRDIPQVGRFAVLSDPSGAVFAIYKSVSPSSPSGPPEVGDVSWHELATKDVERALEFYRGLFGWEETGRHDMGDVGTYPMFGREGHTMGGMFTMPGRSYWLYYVRVADLDGTTAKVREKHGQVVHGPMDVPGGDRIVQCLDPQGALFALHERRSA